MKVAAGPFIWRRLRFSCRLLLFSIMSDTMSFISENTCDSDNDDNANDERGTFTGNDCAVIKRIYKLDLENESLRFRVTYSPKNLLAQVKSNLYPQPSIVAVEDQQAFVAVGKLPDWQRFVLDSQEREAAAFRRQRAYEAAAGTKIAQHGA